MCWTSELSRQPTAGCILKSIIICLLLPPGFSFHYRRSKYTVYLLEEKEIWLNLKQICESSGGYLASFTTVDELKSVLEYVRMNYPDGLYEIGLSRQAGLDRNVDANWKWETGEGFNYSIPWGNSQPDLSNYDHCAVRIRVSTGNMYDIPVTVINPNEKSRGYICEYGITIHCERHNGGCFDLCVAAPELSNNSVNYSCFCPINSFQLQDWLTCRPNGSERNLLTPPSSTIGPPEEDLTTQMRTDDINNACSRSTILTIGVFFLGVIAGVFGVISAQKCYSRIQQRTQIDKRGTDKRKQDVSIYSNLFNQIYRPIRFVPHLSGSSQVAP
ncbi:uncharacterized protein LOC117123191, partial [Anneissia japonica]|uniref:uncharacterized protein LOC117123191 n=1 Tax=Anneissia japonica TaxID=1529436 RepID=UPI001425AED6